MYTYLYYKYDVQLTIIMMAPRRGEARGGAASGDPRSLGPRPPRPAPCRPPRPPGPVARARQKELSSWQSSLCLDLVSFPVLSQVKPQAPLLVVPLRQFL